MKPKCFESLSQYEAWQRADMALNSTRHLRITQSETPVCADCTPTYAMAMRAQGRCEHPETIFKKTGEEFIGVIPIVVIPPPVILKPKVLPNAGELKTPARKGVEAVHYRTQRPARSYRIQTGSVRVRGSAVLEGGGGSSGADDHAQQHERADKEDIRV